jgi:hypothetical protein
MTSKFYRPFSAHSNFYSFTSYFLPFAIFSSLTGLFPPRLLAELLKLDEQPIYNRYKVGIMYCRAGQSTEEQMYNNGKKSQYPLHDSPTMSMIFALPLIPPRAFLA